MTTFLRTAALTALVAGLSISAAVARDGASSLRDFNKETAKARAAGGYGNPVIEVPKAIGQSIVKAADAMTDAVNDVMTGSDEKTASTER
ncbi:MAG: hypothetical protein AAFR17_19805 [Pseudomonadota bacterium]